jgi:hypothetical protein
VSLAQKASFGDAPFNTASFPEAIRAGCAAQSQPWNGTKSTPHPETAGCKLMHWRRTPARPPAPIRVQFNGAPTKARREGPLASGAVAGALNKENRNG